MSTPNCHHSTARTTRVRCRPTGGRALLALALAAFVALAPPASAAVGDLDPQFGTGGLVAIDGNVGPSVLELADGKIVVVGTVASGVLGAFGSAEVAINRYLASGAPDSSFGTDGRVVTRPHEFPTVISAMAEQPDGKLVLAGQYWDGGGRSFVTRLMTDGSLDVAFGEDGVSHLAGTEPFYSSVIVLESGDILAPISDWTNDRIDRYGADGQYLGSVLRIEVAPSALARQSDGRLIVSGYHRTLKRQGVTRLYLDGSVDRAFGDDGFAVLPDGYIGKLEVEPGTDKIVLCGRGIARLTVDGQPDTSFGAQGTGTVSFGSDGVPSFDSCGHLLAMWDGSVVYIGRRFDAALDGDHDPIFIGGLTSDGLVDTRFGGGSGATELTPGNIVDRTGWYWYFTSNLIRTRDGDALITWVTSTGLKLGRIDLDAGTIADAKPASPTPSPPPAPPTTSPPPTPPTTSPTTPPTTSASTSDGGGGGAFDWALVLPLAALARIATRRRRRGAGHLATG